MEYESERTEYKSQFVDDIYKEVIAFANTDGGVLYIGIDDQGNAVGIENMDKTYTRLTNGIRDAIAPDVGFGKRASAYEIVQSEMLELVSLSLHPYLQFTQGIEVFQYAEKHDDEMLVAVETLHIGLASRRIAANLHDFFAIE